MTYMKYYETRYNKKITDVKQPLLISMPKLREERSGVSGPIFLIPELCNMTGLSDEQRVGFSLFKIYVYFSTGKLQPDEEHGGVHQARP